MTIGREVMGAQHSKGMNCRVHGPAQEEVEVLS